MLYASNSPSAQALRYAPLGLAHAPVGREQVAEIERGSALTGGRTLAVDRLGLVQPVLLGQHRPERGVRTLDAPLGRVAEVRLGGDEPAVILQQEGEPEMGALLAARDRLEVRGLGGGLVAEVDEQLRELPVGRAVAEADRGLVGDARLRGIALGLEHRAHAHVGVDAAERDRPAVGVDRSRGIVPLVVQQVPVLQERDRVVAPRALAEHLEGLARASRQPQQAPEVEQRCQRPRPRPRA